MEERYCNATVVMPNATVCFNFVHDAQRLKKSSWLVPHVVRHKDNTDLISWRCSWGHLCESECFYAQSKGGGKTGNVLLDHPSAVSAETDPIRVP
jgi:hypothetical protein